MNMMLPLPPAYLSLPMDTVMLSLHPTQTYVNFAVTFDRIIESIMPSSEGIRKRQRILSFVERVVKQTWDAEVCLCGCSNGLSSSYEYP